MSYDLLRGLYLGSASNADITSSYARRILHVSTGLDDLVPSLAASRRDVVVTGSPGDGKSHLIRTLADREKLPNAVIELDLSAADEDDVIARWRAAKSVARPFVLCGNEGPLKALIGALRREPALSKEAEELAGQVGRLVASSDGELPPEPGRVVLIDLADRSVLDPALIRDAIKQICMPEFFPPGLRGRSTSAGRNLAWLTQSPDANDRLSRLIAAAGRRLGDHVGFRQLWAAISYAICAGKASSTLIQELGRLDDLAWSPLDNLTRGQGQGALIRAFRSRADPALQPWPQLDSDIWANGAPISGEWDVDVEPFAAPSTLWPTDPDAALERYSSIKRLVALFHSAGEELVEAVISSDRDLPSEQGDGELLHAALEGLRRLYVTASEEASAPAWLVDGLPLWVTHTYQDTAPAKRPHVAVAHLGSDEFEIRRALRPAWFGEALGPPPETAWLRHMPSGIALRLEPQLLSTLRRAMSGGGPVAAPDSVDRFLSRLSGWEERHRGGLAGPLAVLDRPRGGLVASAVVLSEGDALRYGGTRADR